MGWCYVVENLPTIAAAMPLNRIRAILINRRPREHEFFPANNASPALLAHSSSRRVFQSFNPSLVRIT